jgi:hypothetical protein
MLDIHIHQIAAEIFWQVRRMGLLDVQGHTLAVALCVILRTSEARSMR